MNLTKKYKHTKLGWIPSEWDVFTLSQVCEIKGRVGWKGYKVEDLRSSGPLVLGAKHISPNNKVNLSDPTYLSRDKYEESPEIKVELNDILLVQRGSLGKVILIDAILGEATINPSMVIIRSKNFNPDFSRYLYYWLCSSYTQRLIITESSSTGVPMISQAQIGSFPFSLPPQDELVKISKILSTWDNAIEKTEQLIQSKTKLKKGLMQQLLTGKSRFKEFEEEEWMDVELGKIGEFKTSSVDKKVVTGEAIVRLVNYMDVYKNRFITSQMKLSETSAKEREIQSSNLYRGDILFTPSSETPDDIGHSAVVTRNLPNTLFSYHLVRFRPNDNGQLDFDFRGYVFNNNEILKEFSRKATGSTRYTLSKKDFEETRARIPSNQNEQQKIALILKTLDNEIAIIRKQLKSLINEKKGLMQKLLTGELRVTKN